MAQLQCKESMLQGGSQRWLTPQTPTPRGLPGRHEEPLCHEPPTFFPKSQNPLCFVLQDPRSRPAVKVLMRHPWVLPYASKEAAADGLEGGGGGAVSRECSSQLQHVSTLYSHSTAGAQWASFPRAFAVVVVSQGEGGGSGAASLFSGGSVGFMFPGLSGSGGGGRCVPGMRGPL